MLLMQCVIKGQKSTFNVKPVSFNTFVNDESCPIYYQGGMVFCSNLRNNSILSYENDGKGFYNLFFVDRNKNGKWKNTALFSNELTSLFNDGPATFNAAGDVIYFCRNNKIKKQTKDIEDASNKIGIYKAEWIDDEWINVTPFVYNNPDYFYLTPALAPNGKRLYFASNMPGGYGGADLYYCDWNGNEWNAPVNMGPVVNTTANELYPFAHKSGKVFFASDGHGGFGGKDIYYTQQYERGWLEPIHLDQEINSSADDFGFITDDEFKTGFFSSNRRKTDDIYSFNRKLIEFDSCCVQKEDTFCFFFFDDQILIRDPLAAHYEWNFSLGTKLQGEKVRYCFPCSGKYSVTLFVINTQTGDTINDPSPFSFELEKTKQPYIYSVDTAYVGDTIQLSGLESYLPDFKLVEYYWDFGDGFKNIGPVVNYEFNKKGNHKVKLGITYRKKDAKEIRKIAVFKTIDILK